MSEDEDHGVSYEEVARISLSGERVIVGRHRNMPGTPDDVYLHSESLPEPILMTAAEAFMLVTSINVAIERTEEID